MSDSLTPHIAALPSVLQSSVKLWFERLRELGGDKDLPDNLLAAIVPVVSCSEFAGTVLLREWPWFVEHAAKFTDVADAREAEDFVNAIEAGDTDLTALKSQLRRYRNQVMLRVLWREVHGLADLDETLQQLSALADRMLDVATRQAARYLAPRFGGVVAADGTAVPLVILGMGKLGGRELNFSSDIDIMFCYPEDGETDGERSLSAVEYFTRLSRHVIALIGEVTVDGFVFRVDTRLRPFGESGPPVVSFAALESYLLRHGRDWERYAYVKARVVGPQPSSQILKELQSDLIRPFVYRRYLDYGVFESLREMHSMIAAEVRRRELADNVKLGPGGIREAEFIVQALQLVRGGSEPALQHRELQSVLPQLISDRGLTGSAAEELLLAYRFLRRVENFIQAIRDQQTHDLPADDTDRARLFSAMGYASWDEFVAVLEQHRAVVRAQFAAIALRGDNTDDDEMRLLRRLWETAASERQWFEALQALTADDARELAASIVGFANASSTRQIDATSSERLQRFMPGLIALVLKAAAPLAALTRTLGIVDRILRRSAYLALLNENNGALARLVSLCERSHYIADQLARYPALLDELLDPRIYSEQMTRRDLQAELQERLADGNHDSEGRMHAIAQYQRATMFRIAVADFNGTLPIMKVSDSLTWLAEVVLEETLSVVWADLTARHGAPQFVVDGVRHAAGFGIVGYGKLGGLELSYGSDLDVVFLHNSTGSQQITDGEKALDNTVFFARLVRRLVHFLTTRTVSGELYEIDTRLRPDGRSGLLVSSVDAFERYQDENAWTWEHQALLRARAVAGNAEVAAEFGRVRHETLSKRVNRETLRDDVISMRRRMRKELDASDASRFDMKHGHGGIGDIEFLVQYLVLREAGEQANVIVYSDNIRQLDALIECGCLTPKTGSHLQEVYRSYRRHLHHLVLNAQPALIDAGLFAAERELVADVWRDWLGEPH